MCHFAKKPNSYLERHMTMTLVVTAHLIHGTTVLQKAWADSHGSYNVAVAAVVVKVNKGERVYVLLERGTAHSINRADRWTNFVGHLIHAF